jgi:lipopolysaccharide export LptBFGC system permease protein LptF
MAFSLLDRYIFCEFVQVMLVGSVIVLGVWFTTDELQMIFSLITTAGVSFEDAMLLLVLHLPKVIAFNMPAAVCIGAVLIFSRLARDSELTTLRLSGVSVQRILLTPVCIGVLAALTSFWLNECVVPVATRTFKSFLAMAVCSTRINSGRTAYTFEEYSKDSQLKRLFLMPFNETKGVSQAVVLNFIDGEVTSIVTSNSLTRDHNRWVLDEGHAYELLCRSGFTHKLDFAKLVLAGVRSQLVTFGPAQTSSSDADFWQLQQYISHLKNCFACIKSFPGQLPV